MYRATARRPAGYVHIADPEAPGGVIERDTLQCAHCDGHWMVIPGSGRRRGWCLRCNGPVCGPACFECKPAELQIYRE